MTDNAAPMFTAHEAIAIRAEARRDALKEAEQAIRLEAVTELSPRENQGLRRALRIVKDLREGRAT
jgi:hypothetical protein